MALPPRDSVPIGRTPGREDHGDLDQPHEGYADAVIGHEHPFLVGWRDYQVNWSSGPLQSRATIADRCAQSTVDLDGALELVDPFPDGRFQVYPVSPRVNNARNEGLELTEPLQA
jgi:hypothetical protein